MSGYACCTLNSTWHYYYDFVVNIYWNVLTYFTISIVQHSTLYLGAFSGVIFTSVEELRFVFLLAYLCWSKILSVSVLNVYCLKLWSMLQVDIEFFFWGIFFDHFDDIPLSSCLLFFPLGFSVILSKVMYLFLWLILRFSRGHCFSAVWMWGVWHSSLCTCSSWSF